MEAELRRTGSEERLEQELERCGSRRSERSERRLRCRGARRKAENWQIQTTGSRAIRGSHKPEEAQAEVKKEKESGEESAQKKDGWKRDGVGEGRVNDKGRTKGGVH